MPIQYPRSPPLQLLYPHPVVPSPPSVQALASSALTHLRYVLTIKSLNWNLDDMVNTELHCVQLFIRYISLVTTMKIDQLPHAVEYCHALHLVLRIAEKCSEVVDHTVRMLSITADLGSHEIGLHLGLGAHGGRAISTRWEDFAGCSAVLVTVSKSLLIELSDFEAQNMTLKCNSLWQVLLATGLCNPPAVGV